ncbi:MAG: pentose kinase [Ruminococcaceae bacterium]|nr:pentose kinase [Oscillospiraceae bacterium]
MKAILAFDLGTSGVKCSLYSVNGKLLGAQYGEYETYYPHADWREQNPFDWIEQIKLACRKLTAGSSDAEICAIGVSGHSLGALPVDAAGKLLVERIPIWSDARAGEQAQRFFEKIGHREWYETTGNGFPAHLYSLFKIMWYQDNAPQVYEKTCRFIGSKDFVNLYLTGVMATDHSYASGCGIYDLKKGVYRADFAEAAGVDIEKFPPIFPSHAIIGRVTVSAAAELGIPEGTPVVAGGVDNACMALGAGCFEDGDTYASLGSSAWITATTDAPVVDYDSMVYTFAHCVPGRFIPSLGIFASGSALKWAADNFFADIQGEDRYDRIAGLADTSAAGAHGLMFNPCLAGGSSADKSPNIRGCLFNLSLGSTKADVARAVFEGIAMHLYATAMPLVRSGKLGNRLLVVGGGAKGESNRQIYADVFGREVAVSRVRQDAASLGAAALAAVGCGVWESFDPLHEIHRGLTISHPNADNHAVYERVLPVYKKLCDACSDLGDLAGDTGLLS